MSDAIGRYRVLGHLGEGHFGKVMLAEGDVPMPDGRRRTRRVAIKKLREPWSMGAFETLVHEFQLLEQVKHRSLCKVYEFLDRECAIVMELVVGVTLRELLDRCRQAGVTVWPEAALEIGCELADCLYQAHATPAATGGQLRLVHRDLKPENVMLTQSGEVKVLDFGLARIDDGVRETGTKGTPLYMAPEQVRDGSVDHRSDLFACGLVLYELLSGDAAYPLPSDIDHAGLEKLMSRIERADLQLGLSRLRRQLPRLGGVVAGCLSASPASRPEHGHALLLQLRACRGPDARGALAEFAGYALSELGLAPPAQQAPTEAMIDEVAPSREIEPGQSMANHPTPPRPGANPPRPDASAPSASRPRLTRPPARPPGMAPAGGKMWAPPTPAQGDAPRPAPPTSAGASDDLRMVRLGNADADEGLGGGPHQQSTQFFALPTPRVAVGDDDEALVPLRKVDPISAASSPTTGLQPGVRAAPPGPGHTGMVPPGATPPMGMAPMQPMQPMHMPMGIQGPVASGQVAGYPPMGGAQMPPDRSADLHRAQSYRVFAVVLGLMTLVLTVVVVVAMLTVYGAYTLNQRDEDKDPTVVVTPPPPPVNAVDTGLAPPPPRGTTPKPPPGPSQPRTPRPSKPPPEPSPAATGMVTVTLGPGSPGFTSIEVVCPGTDFRERASFIAQKASLGDVPGAVTCQVFFKGGASASSTIEAGQNKTCTFQGTVAKCN